MTKTLDKPPRSAPRAPRRSAPKAEARSAKAEAQRAKAERRAKQAELVRVSKPWLKSTGPRTAEGKARTASNALKHGYRSRAYIERIREERQLIRDAASAIGLAKTLLRTLSDHSAGGRNVTVWAGDDDPDGRQAQPNPPPLKPL